jgi:hypothetical protein
MVHTRRIYLPAAKYDKLNGRAATAPFATVAKRERGEA